MMVSSSGIFSLLLSAPVLLSFHTMPVTAQESLSDGNIRSAVQMWINNGEEAEMLYGRIEDWDVSRVTNFTSLFDSTVDFSADLGAWNTASVTTLRAAFYNSVGFSANIAAWDTSKVTDMRVMLAYASDFSSDISQWNVQNVQTMLGTFTYYSYSSEKTDSSNDETIAISGWNTDSLMDMEGLFAGTSYFHTDLSSWTTSKVTNMAFMLEYSEHFYGGDLSNLDTSNVEIMEHMFASSLNVRGARDILRWDVSRVTSMERIFYNSTITFEEGTAPLDSDLFYICWSSMPNLDEGDLSEAFCESNAGGFNCACLGESIMPTVNSQCTGSQRPCFNSLGSVEGFDADSLISGSWRAAPISSSLSFLLTVISMFRGFI